MQRLLVIQTAFIGDVILATPLVEKLAETFPGAEIDFLLRKGNQSLLDHHPHIRHVWIWDKGKEKYRGLLDLLRQIRSRKYDLVVNCQRFPATGLVTALSGARFKAGFSKNPLSFFFTHRAPHLIGQTHEVDRNLALIQPWTGPAERIRPRLYPQASDYKGLPPEKSYVTLAPTSVWFTKQWPAEKWVELIRCLPSGLGIYLLGGRPDREACEQIRLQANREEVVNLAGQLSFLQSAAWMEKARMNYVNDSAPLHLASAVNAPVAAIFCSTIPAFGFGPLSDNSQVFETALSLDCRPCGLHGKSACPRGHFACAQIEAAPLARLAGN